MYNANVVKIQYSESNQIVLFKALLFVAFPLLSVIWALVDLRHRSSYCILFVYGLFIGYNLTINESAGFDSLRYVEVFDTIQLTFFIDFADWITYSSSIKDFYLHTLSYIVSSYTSDYHFLFLSASIVFSFLCLNCLRILTEQFEYKNTFICFCIVFLFFISNSIIGEVYQSNKPYTNKIQ